MTRKEAINMLYGIKAENLCLDDAYTSDRYEALKIAIEALEQEPKTGHWIKVNKVLPLSDSRIECVRCNRCGTHWDYGFKFCPNCGCRMESEVKDADSD